MVNDVALKINVGSNVLAKTFSLFFLHKFIFMKKIGIIRSLCGCR